MPEKVFAVVPAAGQGTRIGDALPKQYLPIAGKPMLFHSLDALAAVDRIARILVVLSPVDPHWETQDWSGLDPRVEALYIGGASRAASVSAGLRALEGAAADDDWVLVHDAARPCVQPLLVEQFLDELEGDPVGGLLALPLADTLKEAGEGQRVARTVPREGLWRAQTPQMFRYARLRQALDMHPRATDEAQAIEASGAAPRLVSGESTNIKVTFAEDLQLAEWILMHRNRMRL
jgi:2-C-methyl-D-erythritol 4-phosphate cytidylyltransferase